MFCKKGVLNPLTVSFYKMVKHTQTIFRQFADEFFECVWPFGGIGAQRVKNVAKQITTKTPFLINLQDGDLRFFCKDQGRSQNLKAVPQNFKEVFKVDDVTSNDVIQKKNRWRKEELRISLIRLFNIKFLKNTWKLVFISKGISSQFQYFLDWNLYDDFTVRSSN